MAPETDPVRIVVDIVDNFSDELQELRQELNRIDAKDLDVDLDIDDQGDIESVRARLEALRERINSDLNIDTHGFTSAMAQKQALQGDMRSTLRFSAEEQGVLGELREMSLNSVIDDTDMRRHDTSNRFMSGLVDERQLSAGADFMDSIQDTLSESRAAQGGAGGMPGPDGFDLRRGQPAVRAAFSGGDMDITSPGRMGSMMPDADLREVTNVGGAFEDLVGVPVADWAADNRRSLGKLGRTLLEYRPSIMDWWNVLALMIPIMITLAGAALGLAAALIAVGTAAVGILGVGLLGWGDDMQSTLQNLQTEARALAKELFGVMQPVAQQAQPIVDDWLEGVPRQAQRLADAFEPMLAYSDGLASMGTGVIDFIVTALGQMAEVQEQVTQVTLRMGSAIGSFLTEAMMSLVLELYKNQEALIDIGEMFIAAIVIIYNLSKAVSFLIAQFGFFLQIAAVLTGFLSNKWVVAMLTAITTALLLEAALTAIATAYAAVQAGVVATAIATMKTYIPTVTSAIAQTWAWVTAVSGLNAALRATLLLAGGIGAAWAIGSMAMGAMDSMSGPRSGAAGTGVGGSNGGTYINIQGDVKKKEMDRLLDRMPSEANDEYRTMQSMEGN